MTKKCANCTRYVPMTKRTGECTGVLVPRTAVDTRRSNAHVKLKVITLPHYLCAMHKPKPGEVWEGKPLEIAI